MKILLFIALIQLLQFKPTTGAATVTYQCRVSGTGQKTIYIHVAKGGDTIGAVYADGKLDTCRFSDVGADAFDLTIDVTAGSSSADYTNCGLAAGSTGTYKVNIVTQSMAPSAGILTAADKIYSDVGENANCNFATIAASSASPTISVTAATSTLTTGTATSEALPAVTLEVFDFNPGTSADTKITDNTVNFGTNVEIKIKMRLANIAGLMKAIKVTECWAYPASYVTETVTPIQLTNSDGCSEHDVMNKGAARGKFEKDGTLSSASLFIATSTPFAPFRTATSEDVTLRCFWKPCFAANVTVCDNAGNNCPAKRRKRDIADETASGEQSVTTTFRVISEPDNEGGSNGANTGSENNTTVSCLQSMEFLIITIVLGVLLILAIGVALYAVYRLRLYTQNNYKEDLKSYDNRSQFSGSKVMA